MVTGNVANGWKSIESAPKDTELLVYSRAWGPIIAVLSDEFGEWLSRMQVPVSIKEENELPTHWQPLPAAPDEGGGSPERLSEAAPA